MAFPQIQPWSLVRILPDCRNHLLIGWSRGQAFGNQVTAPLTTLGPQKYTTYTVSMCGVISWAH